MKRGRFARSSKPVRCFWMSFQAGNNVEFGFEAAKTVELKEEENCRNMLTEGNHVFFSVEQKDQ